VSGSRHGQSLALFVVQRTFPRVRRGYDPDEVDRHLELVSRWFASTPGGEAFAHERTRLAERSREVERELHGAQVEAEAILEGARRRADADARSAAGLLDQARAEAEAERSRLLDAAREEAAAERARLVAEAAEERARLVAEAAEERARLLAAAEEEVREYVARRRREADRLVAAARRERRRPAE
jgi:DivIVA domain-containing protein